MSKQRLIDAYEFKRFVHEQLEPDKSYSQDEIWEMIKERPTAYDLEKVVEELKHPNNYTIVAGKHFTTVERAIEIVKRGGLCYENTTGNPGEP